jgi:hypothetical protein
MPVGAEFGLQALCELVWDRRAALVLAELSVALPLWTVARDAAELTSARHDAVEDELVVGASDVGEPHADLGVDVALLEQLGEASDAIDATRSLLELRRVPGQVVVEIPDQR